MAVITLAGEQLIAKKQAAEEALVVTDFVLAYVPGLDPNQPIDRNQVLPSSSQIKCRMPYTRRGYVNLNEVVYSLILDNTIGNFEFNWLGLMTEEDVLLAANHMWAEPKRKNNPLTGEEGNNLTRNFLLNFSGAQAITNITIPIETWQFNYTEKLNEMDQLLVSLTTGLLSTQKNLVELSHENMVLSEFNRESTTQLNQLRAEVGANKQLLAEHKTDMERQHNLMVDDRHEMDITLTATVIETQSQTIQNDFEIMKLSEQIRKVEKQHE